MKIVKTIKFQVHRKTTKSKIEELDSLTAHLTFATDLFLGFIKRKDTVKFKNRKIPVWQDHRTFEFVEWKEGRL